MKKIEIGCFVLSFILIIMIICSLRSNWEKVSINFTNTKESINIERSIYSSEILSKVLILDDTNTSNGIAIPIAIDWFTSTGTHTINAFGALSIIFLFFYIINLFKVNIKFIGSNLYAIFEKISIVLCGLITLFTILCTFISFGLSVEFCLPPSSQFDNNQQCFKTRFVEKTQLKDIGVEFQANLYTLKGGQYSSGVASGFVLMVLALLISIGFTITAALRFKEIKAPSTSIDYRFLYNGEDSSFLQDDDPDEFDDSRL